MFKNLRAPFDKYEVSDKGEVRRKLVSGTYRYLKGTLTDTGHLCVYLSDGAHIRKVGIHRLVARLFISNPLNLKYVKHIDGNKLNNSANNLQYVTYQDIHPTSYSRNSIAVKCVETHEEYPSMYRLSKHLEVSTTLVRTAVKTGKAIKGLHYTYCIRLLEVQ